MILTQIGEIRNEYTKHKIPYDLNYFNSLKSRLILDKKYQEGLQGLKPGQLIDVIYYMHEIDTKDIRLKDITKQGDLSRPPTGLFNTRSPFRINPLGITRSRIIEIKDNIVTVTGLDALNSSPLIDIKPYMKIKDIDD